MVINSWTNYVKNWPCTNNSYPYVGCFASLYLLYKSWLHWVAIPCITIVHLSINKQAYFHSPLTSLLVADPNDRRLDVRVHELSARKERQAGAASIIWQAFLNELVVFYVKSQRKALSSTGLRGNRPLLGPRLLLPTIERLSFARGHRGHVVPFPEAQTSS